MSTRDPYDTADLIAATALAAAAGELRNLADDDMLLADWLMEHTVGDESPAAVLRAAADALDRGDIDARTASLGSSRCAQGQPVDVDVLLANVARSVASARDDAERAEAVEMLLSGWYAAWPDSAVTDPDGPLAAELVRLLGPPMCDCESYDCRGECCGVGKCSCTPTDDHPRTAVLSWDWREQPDLEELARAVRDVSGGTVHVCEVDTGSADYVIVIAERVLDDEAAQAVYDREYR